MYIYIYVYLAMYVSLSFLHTISIYKKNDVSDGCCLKSLFATNALTTVPVMSRECRRRPALCCWHLSSRGGSVLEIGWRKSGFYMFAPAALSTFGLLQEEFRKFSSKTEFNSVECRKCWSTCLLCLLYFFLQE